jgi:hypothetical protein
MSDIEIRRSLNNLLHDLTVTTATYHHLTAREASLDYLQPTLSELATLSGAVSRAAASLATDSM